MRPRLVFVVDPSRSPEHTRRVVDEGQKALPEGAFAVMLRDKVGDLPTLAALAGAFAEGTPTSPRVPLLLALGMEARRLEAAITLVGSLVEAGAVVGLHMGDVTRAREQVGRVRQALPPSAEVTVACHDDEGAGLAGRLAVSGAFVSPIFASPGKGAPRGLEALRRARVLAPRVRLYALGGVTVTEAPACFTAGAHGVAVVRALYDAPRPGEIARRLHDGAPAVC